MSPHFNPEPTTTLILSVVCLLSLACGMISIISIDIAIPTVTESTKKATIKKNNSCSESNDYIGDNIVKNRNLKANPISKSRMLVVNS